jgi:hypothetical protein
LATSKEQLQGTSALNAVNPAKQIPSNFFQNIRSNKNIIIAHADKNLGPIGIDTEKYIRWALDEHLTDVNTYLQESEHKSPNHCPQTLYDDLPMDTKTQHEPHQRCHCLHPLLDSEIYL